ncbi:MAG: adenylate/guanylate cyclase domain-containing protein [Myxococcota bacterium]
MNPDQSSSILAPFFRRAADTAEIATGRIRIAILLLVQLRLVAVALPEMARGAFKHWFTTGVIVGGIAASVAVVRAVTRASDKDRLLVASTVLDAALAFLVVVPSVLWPRDGYPGALAVPDFGIWPLVAVGAGLRLSARAARAGAVAATLGVVALVALDRTLNADRIRYGAPEIALAIVLMIGATAMALAMEARIRRLVGQGAEAAVRAERARQRLGAYVSEEVAAVVLREPDAVPGGERREAAVLFTDLRGFTRTGESMSPDQLIAELNAYLEAMVPVVHAFGGVVDKYMGDAILAVFGVPEPTGDEATRAILAAEAMDRALVAHNRDRGHRGLPPLRHGIGVHFGPVAAGHVGTRERLQYTVIGDTVNVASRLQTATKDAGVSVLLSETLVARAAAEGDRAPPTRSVPPVELRGRTGAIAVRTFDAAGPPRPGLHSE